MSTSKKVVDIFLCYSPIDSGIARVVRQAFEEEGFTVFSTNDVEAASHHEDEIRSAILEAREFVAILTPGFVNSPRLAFEFGGAWGWSKPISLVLDSLSPRDVPHYLKSHRLIPIAHLGELIKELRRSPDPLSDDQRDHLVRLYREMGVPADQLLQFPASLDELTRRFHDSSGSHLSSDRVVQEIIRLRKKGKLGPLRARKSRAARS